MHGIGFVDDVNLLARGSSAENLNAPTNTALIGPDAMGPSFPPRSTIFSILRGPQPKKNTRKEIRLRSTIKMTERAFVCLACTWTRAYAGLPTLTPWKTRWNARARTHSPRRIRLRDLFFPGEANVHHNYTPGAVVCLSHLAHLSGR